MGHRCFSGLKKDDKPCFLDKITGVFFVCLVHTQIRTGSSDAAYGSLCRAKELAERFDTAPAYKVNTIRFVTHGEEASVHDNLGLTAADSIRKAISSCEDETLSSMWKKMNGVEGDDRI